MTNKIEITRDVTLVIDDETSDGVMHLRTHTDQGFSKVWIDLMMVALGITGSSKAAVIGHLLQARDSNNRVHGSFDELAAAAKTGRATVARTMSALQKAGLVERERDGVYVVSPDWVWTGGHKHRMAVLLEFKQMQHPETRRYKLEDASNEDTTSEPINSDTNSEGAAAE